jgi:hypothetical protein
VAAVFEFGLGARSVRFQGFDFGVDVDGVTVGGVAGGIGIREVGFGQELQGVGSALGDGLEGFWCFGFRG